MSLIIIPSILCNGPCTKLHNCSCTVKQDYEGSLDLFSDMRKLADELQLSDQQLQAEEGLARCYLTTGQLDKAHHHMDAHAGLAKLKGNAMVRSVTQIVLRAIVCHMSCA